LTILRSIYIPYTFPSLFNLSRGFRTFHVPGTDTIIYLILGMPVDWSSLLGLLLVSQSVVFEELEYYSEDTGLPIEPQRGGGYAQSFEYTFFDGVNISVTNENAKLITLGNMRDLLHGLRVYLADGYRSYACAFKFSAGREMIGKGIIESEADNKAGH